jgi:hypothetical protein
MTNQKHTVGDVTIEYDFAAKRPKWLERLVALGNFLKAHSGSNETIHIYADENRNIGGLRVYEVSFCTESGGAYYQRDTEGQDRFFTQVERFLRTHGEPVYRPQGWSSCINDNGESRLALLRAMGLTEAADKEYQEQLEFEKSVLSTPV